MTTTRCAVSMTTTRCAVSMTTTRCAVSMTTTRCAVSMTTTQCAVCALVRVLTSVSFTPQDLLELDNRATTYGQEDHDESSQSLSDEDVGDVPTEHNRYVYRYFSGEFRGYEELFRQRKASEKTQSYEPSHDGVSTDVRVKINQSDEKKKSRSDSVPTEDTQNKDTVSHNKDIVSLSKDTHSNDSVDKPDVYVNKPGIDVGKLGVDVDKSGVDVNGVGVVKVGGEDAKPRRSVHRQRSPKRPK